MFIVVILQECYQTQAEFIMQVTITSYHFIDQRLPNCNNSRLQAHFLFARDCSCAYIARWRLRNWIWLRYIMIHFGVLQNHEKKVVTKLFRPGQPINPF